jgi:two-component system, OmpR family, sensor histidine kinase VicK
MAPDRDFRERIEVVYDSDITIKTILQIFDNAKNKWDYCGDTRSLSMIFSNESTKKALLDTKRKGIRLRFVTDITKDNIRYLKDDIMNTAEVRHLDGVRGNFAISDTEYISVHIPNNYTLTPTKSLEPTLHYAVYSNVKQDIQQQQYVFDTFWNKSISAELRIREIKQGSTRYETRIIDDSQEVIEEISRLTANSNELYTCLTPGGIQYSYNHFFEIKKELLKKQKTGQHKGIKYITHIDRDNAALVKILLDAGIKIRHVRNLPPMSFGVSDKEIAATIEKMKGGRLVDSLLLSNEPAYINHFKSVFEELWKDGIDAAEMIKDLELGVQSDIEVIPNSARAARVYLNLVKNAKEEIMIIFPTTGAFIRQSKLGVIDLAKLSARLHDTNVRILMPSSKLTDQMILDLKLDYPDNFNIRYYVEQTSAAKATILVVDRKDSLVMELRDDSTTTFDEAIGFSTHSDSRPGVLSYVAIFENIWTQTEMFEDLKVRDRVQREFINVAAHELRTPIQPILGLTEVLRSQIKDVKQRELLDITIRNAKRMQRLTEDILDVTKIETKTLDLKKELFNISELIMITMTDYKNQIAKENKDKSLTLQLIDSNEGIFLEADKGRIYQVISNLLSNAIKFTTEGSISIVIKKNEKQDHEEKYKEVVISISDTGTGIDPDILPRLFTKFATKSTAAGGTGLGLFISKSIVEAHGGRIWAENNSDSKGATFKFSLPFVV